MAGRKDPSGLSGHLLVNGAKQPKNFMHMTGYVVQVRAELTKYRESQILSDVNDATRNLSDHFRMTSSWERYR